MDYDMSYPRIYTMETIEQASACLLCGELVAFPTETVFGLGAVAYNEVAVNRVFQAKGRPSDNPLIVHVASIAQVHSLVDSISETALQLMQTFWPGPLTIIFPAKKDVFPSNVTAGKATVAIRMPNQPETLELIEAVGAPLVGPSANVSGRPSPTQVAHVVEDLRGKIAGVLEPKTNPSAIGVESTVVYPKEDGIYVLRPGAITVTMLKQLGYKVYELSPQEQLVHHELLSPGVKYRHYSPQQPVYLMTSSCSLTDWQMQVAQLNGKVGILALNDICNAMQQCVHMTYSLGTNIEEATRNLYSGLRALEQSEVDVILAQGFDMKSEGSHAYMNRLTKASTFEI